MLPKGFLVELEAQIALISDERKAVLNVLIKHMNERMSAKNVAIVKFICTHNSRRSQLAEFMLDVLSREAGHPVKAISAGTESTAFNPRMVKAITSYGFEIEKFGNEANPLYIYKAGLDDYYYYSKKYNEDIIHYDDPIIVTVCGDAEQNCPVIPGTFTRQHVGYEDPKASDNTNTEAQVYRDKVLEIGGQMLYVVKKLKHSPALIA